MFCSLDIFRYVLAYAISCLETISSQYVRIVDICRVLGYQVFLALNVVSRCSDVFCSLDITRTILIDSPLKAKSVAALQFQFYLYEYLPNTVLKSPSVRKMAPY